MQLSDFQEVIILAATFYIAFVAVDYVKSFSTLLYEKVFRLPDFISTHIAKLIKLQIDSESLENIAKHEIDGKTLVQQVEQVRRTNEILCNETTRIKESHTELLKSACSSKNIQSICLFIFVICLTALIMNGIEDTWENYTHWVWMSFSLLSTLYLGLTTIQKISSKIANFKGICVTFCIIFFISVGSGFLSILYNIPMLLWKIWLPLSILMIWGCFFFIFITIYRQVKLKKQEFVNDVNKVLQDQRFKDMHQTYHKLQSVDDLASL